MASGFHKPGRTKNSLHILAGKYKGTKLASPNLKTTHPMGSREKLALFNMLAPYLEGAKVLDYFAGSGALGLEALSRGASEVVFCENNRKAQKVIDSNIQQIGDLRRADEGWSENGVPPEKCFSEGKNFLGVNFRDRTPNHPRGTSQFAIIISDPPYDDYQVPDYASLLAPGGILALSHPSSFDPRTISGLTLLKTNSYAACNISLFTK